MQGYVNRAEAGRVLASALNRYAHHEDVIVLALPRGGVAVGFEVAIRLGVAMDLLLVHRLGMPGHKELAMGAVASNGIWVMNDALAEHVHVSEQRIGESLAREYDALEKQERAYRGDRPFPELAHRTVILVDDGLATGSTMRAAVAALRPMQPERVVAAAPVSPQDTVDKLGHEADEVVCPLIPARFLSVSQWYREFEPITDDEVCDLLGHVWKARGGGQARH